MAQFLQTKRLIEEALKAGCKTWEDFEKFKKEIMNIENKKRIVENGK